MIHEEGNVNRKGKTRADNYLIDQIITSQNNRAYEKIEMQPEMNNFWGRNRINDKSLTLNKEQRDIT